NLMKLSSVAPHVAPRHLFGVLRLLLPWVLLASALPAQAVARTPAADHVVIQTEDVARFFQVLDANQGRPSAQDLQRHYL
ncbi:hypothetical protein ACS229_30790, partial [Klebsiella pneumoniae]|uniref:hypothetical protein n=1 Tax=Klebsiella pneumoniae TaxID=573 RepID=UPI003F22B902